MRFIIGGPRLFGLRTGILLNLKDLGFGPRAKTAGQGGAAGGFIYVIKGDHGHVKVGVSINPIDRLATLQTGSPFKLWIDYAGALTGFGFGLEGEAHDALDRFRLEGEWFSCSTEVAVGTLSALAHKRGEKIAAVDPAIIPDIVRIVAQSNASTPPEYSRNGKIMMFAVAVGVGVGIYVFVTLMAGP